MRADRPGVNTLPPFKLPPAPVRRRWKAPKHLAPATRRWFASVVRDYELEEHHVRLLTAAAEAWDRMVQAATVLNAAGLTFEDRFGQPRARPEVGIERDSRLAFARLLRELALDAAVPEDPRPPGILGRERR